MKAEWRPCVKIRNDLEILNVRTKDARSCESPGDLQISPSRIISQVEWASNLDTFLYVLGESRTRFRK